MKALVLENTGEKVVYKEVDEPRADLGEAIIKLKAAALNHRDLWITKGLYAGIKTPIILGSDGAGIVEGANVLIYPGINWGDNENFQSNEFKIVGLPDNGTLAERVHIPRKNIYLMPEHLSFEEGAALPLAGLTAWRALMSRAAVQPNEKVLISGIGGGVALMAMQFAVANGNEVYITSSSDEKIAKAIEMGAKGGINYTSDNWGKELAKLSGGIDVIIDGAGGEGFSNFLNACNPGARISIYGTTRGNLQDLNARIIFWKQISILGTTMGSDEDFEDMLFFVSEHKIKPVIHKIYPLEDGAKAFEDMENGEQFGKLVISI